MPARDGQSRGASGLAAWTRSETVRKGGLTLLLAICLVGWITPQMSIDFRRARWEETESLLFLPTGEYLESVSLGYQNLVADALYLWSIQYYGHHRSELGRRYLWRIYDVITDLDPRYQDAYLTGALIMAVDMGDAEMAIELLDKGAAENPDDWIYPLEAGYYAWINLEDYRRADRYFARAQRIPGAPGSIVRIRAGLAEFSGSAREALAMWRDIYETAVAEGDERIESIAWQHIYDLKVGIDLEVLREAVDRFRADRGRPPRALGALALQGYLQQVPRTPEGDEYPYDPVTGRVGDPSRGSRASR